MVKLKNYDWGQFSEKIKEKRLYCFGCGNMALWLSYEVSGYQIADSIEAFIDNDKRKVGSFVKLDGRKIPIIAFEEFVMRCGSNTILLITNMYYREILQQLDREERLNNLECCIEVFLDEKYQSQEHIRTSQEQQLIPPIIHYCWFGKSEIPREYKAYMETWKQYCPDYEIIRWDEENYDYKKNTYIAQAYREKKWAFVSDYARLDVVYQMGGIYLDIDVEILRSLDELRKNKMFCGFEQGNYINTGLGFGAQKGHPHLKGMLQDYENIDFIKADGSLNLKACTEYQTAYLKKIGLQRNGRYQTLDDGSVTVYPRTVFAPIDFYGIHKNITEQTYTVHHYAATWFANGKDGLLKENTEIMRRMTSENV
jgi:hypothetical protein